jgi:hypothetical protein
MLKKNKKSMLDKKMADPEYKKRFDERFGAFKLEAQLLHAMEMKGWGYNELAAAIGSHKSNLSRDFKQGGLFNAAYSRINKMAAVLGMTLVSVLIPKNQERILLPKIDEVIRSAFNSTTPAFWTGSVHAAQSQSPFGNVSAGSLSQHLIVESVSVLTEVKP